MDDLDAEPQRDELGAEPQTGEPDHDTTEPEFAPVGFERWRRETAVGAVGTGIVRGLQNVFAPPQDQVVMVAPVPGDPPDPDRLVVTLDPDDPTKSTVVVPPRAGDGDHDPVG